MDRRGACPRGLQRHRVRFQPQGCGFHYSATPRKQVDATFGTFYNITPVTDRFPGTLHGVTVVMLGFWFVTTMAPLDLDGWKVDYRPQEFGSWDTNAGFRFDWAAPGNQRTR